MGLFEIHPNFNQSLSRVFIVSSVSALATGIAEMEELRAAVSVHPQMALLEAMPDELREDSVAAILAPEISTQAYLPPGFHFVAEFVELLIETVVCELAQQQV